MYWIQGDAENPDSFMDQLPEKINALTFCPGKVILGPLKRLRKEQMLDAYKTSVLDAFTLIQSLMPRLEGSIVLLSGRSPYWASQPLCNFCGKIRT